MPTTATDTAFELWKTKPDEFVRLYVPVIHGNGPLCRKPDTHGAVSCVMAGGQYSGYQGTTSSGSTVNPRDMHIYVGYDLEGFKLFKSSDIGDSHVVFNAFWIEDEMIREVNKSTKINVQTLSCKNTGGTVLAVVEPMEGENHRLSIGSQKQGDACSVVRTTRWTNSDKPTNNQWKSKDKQTIGKSMGVQRGSSSGHTTVIAALMDGRWQFYSQTIKTDGRVWTNYINHPYNALK